MPQNALDLYINIPQDTSICYKYTNAQDFPHVIIYKHTKAQDFPTYYNLDVTVPGGETESNSIFEPSLIQNCTASEINTEVCSTCCCNMLLYVSFSII